jgi:hypothetical protein
MNSDDEIFDAAYRGIGKMGVLKEPPVPPRRDPPSDDDTDLNSIAHSEGWLTPPREVTRITLRPWQQAVFWGLRAYIVVMLGVMVVGFAKVAAGQ